ncbi:MAG: Trk system potassium transporter TrkA [Bacteriovoracaceae bacterium]
MKILIVGAGQVGFQLASMLSNEEHDVCVIENDEERLLSVKEKIDAKVVYGSGTNAISLEEAGIMDTDLFIAVSSVDEVNIMSCLLAKEYGVKRSVARVHNNDYVIGTSRLSNIKLGIERVVNPQQVVSEEVSELCDFADASEVAKFFNDKLLHLGYPIKENSPYIDRELKGISTLNNKKIMVVTSICRDGQTFTPSKNEKMKVGDMIFFFCKKKDLELVREHFGIQSHSTKNIFVVGGGKIGYQVSKKLEETRHKVKVFDRDRDICNKIANDLDVDVFCTVNTDVDTLENEGVASADVVVTMMNDDNSNILTALLTKTLGAKKAVALVNSRKLTALAYSLGVDSTISPRLATASSILKHIRRGKIVSVVEKVNSEILEIEITNSSKITKNIIKEINRPDGVIFGGVKRGDQINLLSGDDQLHVGDILVAHSPSESIAKLEELLEHE